MTRPYRKSTPEEIAAEPDARKRNRKKLYRRQRAAILRRVKIYNAMNYEKVRERANARRNARHAADPELAEKARQSVRNYRARKKAAQQSEAVTNAVNDKLANLKARAKS